MVDKRRPDLDSIGGAHLIGVLEQGRSHVGSQFQGRNPVDQVVVICLEARIAECNVHPLVLVLLIQQVLHGQGGPELPGQEVGIALVSESAEGLSLGFGGRLVGELCAERLGQELDEGHSPDHLPVDFELIVSCEEFVAPNSCQCDTESGFPCELDCVPCVESVVGGAIVGIQCLPDVFPECFLFEEQFLVACFVDLGDMLGEGSFILAGIECEGEGIRCDVRPDLPLYRDDCRAVDSP